MSDALHYSHELHELADGRLDETQARVVELHVTACATCRAELAAIRGLKEALRELPSEEMPADLAVSVSALLDAEDQQHARLATLPPEAIQPSTASAPTTPLELPSSASSPGRPSRRVFGQLAAAAAVVLAVGGGWAIRRWWVGDLVSVVENDYRRFLVGALRVDMPESDAAALDQRFGEKGLPFRARVFDLGMMEYRLTGGAVHRVGDQPSAMFAYRGPTGEDVLCQMFLGRATDASATSDVRDNNDIRFFVHRRGEVTLVFWQEGEVVCVLTSSAPLETVVQLAFAKAMKV